ncbi:hypothetical protein BU24DRAFT_364414 [Aaosphaeria arxii CBS 175.79]|uniref:Nucleoporin Nup120/160 n=1 Tax=Aaosphaeria arxii CBS 175.79 TaxID=1450172 RepID=A0A6A5Y0F9_9PLEO|nr:uncharacterized protein BU24DRAFT_364414 [Aaosphaeria arxii CBS 175.79]KAF2019028.1 hypothetical protein BU24DRAFT_364414 [Aaosphaeria arxii CBS 175.79]
MANNRGTCLYTEARLNIQPAYPGSTIAFTLPATTTSTFGTRTQPKRSVVNDESIGQDEGEFARRHLGTDGSMYFRRKQDSYPRSLLWRLLDKRKALEIQAVDLDQDSRGTHEANLTIILQFSAPIRPFCIAFAEPDDRDAVTIFAITSANDLYSITLHRDFFSNPTASEQDIGDWCKRSSINQFVLRVPYRLTALNHNELLVSLDNGGILQLKRDAKDELAWSEILYQQSSWTGSVRGWLPWKGEQKIRFDNTDLDATAAAAVALSPDKQHIFSVCLNHRLRVWNIASGRPGLQLDLLGEPIHTNEKTTPYFIGPSQLGLMSVVNIQGGVDGALYHVVTYSPKQHQFKFWGIRDADDLELGFYEVKQGVDFIPPVDELMDSTVWTLEEFIINPGPAGWRGTELWIRARSGPSSRVYSLKFDLNEDSKKLAEIWKNEWVSVDLGPLTIDALKTNPSNPSDAEIDPSEAFDLASTEKWLDFLFFPSRFTTATLETALVVFQRGFSQEKGAQIPTRGSLKERICSTIGAFAAIRCPEDSDALAFEESVAAQWQAFYGLIRDLHKRRGESLSLVYDFKEDMPWLVQSDYVTAIRQCSEPETFRLNVSALSSSRSLSGPLRKQLPNNETGDVARLLNAAASFRRGLPTSFQQQLQDQVEAELLQSQSLSIVDRMELLEQNLDLSRQVSDEDLSLLVEDLGMDVKDLTTDKFLHAISLLGQKEEGSLNRKRQATRYGVQALITISQEVLQLNYSTLLDLLVLVLFMQFEEDLSEEFEASEVYIELINQLKDCVVLTWLASNAWANQASTGPSSENMMKHLSDTYNLSRKLPLTQTVLEGIYGHRAFDLSIPRVLKSNFLTYWARAWLSQTFEHRGYDATLDDIMGILLLQKEYVVAARFSKLLGDDNYTTYLKGRMHVALGENHLASICFQKAAYHLGVGMFSLEDADTINLIPVDQQDSFSDGLPKYYHHVLGLFEKVKAYTYVADFARLGLRALNGNENEELKTDLLLRLFTASVQTSRFDEAYTALTRHTNSALRFSDLRKLVKVMIQQDQTQALLKFPFVGLVDDVDNILTDLCHNTLNLSSGPPYYEILYAFRISRNNFRGAAAILYERLQRLKTTSSQAHDPADESLTQCYLMIINTLSSVSKEDAYLLADQRIADPGAPQWGLGKAKKSLTRQIVTLDSLRKEYQAELDRVEAIENGQYPFLDNGDDMDIL